MIISTVLTIMSVLLGVIVTLSVITMDLSVFNSWAYYRSFIENGFWTVSGIKAFHLGEMIAISCTWIQVFLMIVVINARFK